MKRYTAVVSKVENGTHGPYALAGSEELSGSISFSLKPPVWTERTHPEPGSVVILSDITKKRAGWRANSGRFFRPEDEKAEKQNKERE